MSGYVCPSCGTEDAIFGKGGAEGLAASFEVPLLARIPLVGAVREDGDAGKPIVLARPEHPVSQIFKTLAARVRDELARRTDV
jgi:ATP-binding protein involved in chromosome partitioning